MGRRRQAFAMGRQIAENRNVAQTVRGRGRFMFDGIFQPTHLLVIFFIALLVFGPKKLPELGKGIGDGIRALKRGLKDPTAEEPKCSNANDGSYDGQ
jgi:sec-independent protein translocase protein TatA